MLGYSDRYNHVFPSCVDGMLNTHFQYEGGFLLCDPLKLLTSVEFLVNCIEGKGV